MLSLGYIPDQAPIMKQRSFGIHIAHLVGQFASGAGAVRISNAVGAAFTDRRVLEPVEARLMTIAGLLLVVLPIFFAFFPRGLAYPLLFIFAWLGVGLLYRSYKLRREGKRGRNPKVDG